MTTPRRRPKFSNENHRQDLSKSQKLQQRPLGPFTVTKRITKTTYQIQDDNDLLITTTGHRNNLRECYSKEETLPPRIEEYVPMDRRHDDFSERLMKQRKTKLFETKIVNLINQILIPRIVLPLILF